MCGVVRAFLRYLHLKGFISTALADCVPAISVPTRISGLCGSDDPWPSSVCAPAKLPPSILTISTGGRARSWHTPSSRQTVRLLTADVDTLPRNERAFVNAISSASPDVAAAAGLARRFQSMICNRETAALKPRLHYAVTGPMSSFARGIRRDIDAVYAALTMPWSTGPVEGKINKLKLIKRSMYGRAGMGLLRSRIIGT
ncbi:transposase [Rhizobium mayense]|uniref:Transposase n=2 Tax=Rhizobium mayense TaxID=1312184 RepID=A0ABT7K5G6_9HYPH|nr:transposase [Rhizobium mayense]MDL2402379.1 transposase [Rhizobium mayense]